MRLAAPALAILLLVAVAAAVAIAVTYAASRRQDRKFKNLEHLMAESLEKAGEAAKDGHPGLAEEYMRQHELFRKRFEQLGGGHDAR